VIEKLHTLDQVAYVRFASVYREFSDVSEFMDTLRQLASTSSKAVKEAKNVFPMPSSGTRKANEATRQQELKLVEKPPRE
jgi:hypothetical protein